MQLIPYDVDLFRSPFESLYSSLSQIKSPMSTDIIESEKETKIIMDIPGFKKENIEITLENNLLTVSASIKSESNEEDSEGNYIRRERSLKECSRSFSVREGLTEDDIKAKLEDGTLTLTIPKKDKEMPSAKTIKIE